MKVHLSNRFWALILLLTILLPTISSCGQGCVPNPDGTGCEPPPTPVPIIWPAAETPVLETIYDFDNKLIAPMHPMGFFEIQPGKRFVLRLRAIWPTDIQVRIDNQALPEVTDSAGHPELDSSGYYRIDNVIPIHSADPRFFWQVAVVLPLDKRGSVDFTLTVHDISKNPNLSGTDKEAPPLQVGIRRTPFGFAKPSAVFLMLLTQNTLSKGLTVLLSPTMLLWLGG